MTLEFTASEAFRSGFITAATTVLAGTDALVSDGHPGQTQLDDIVAVLGIQSEQEPGAMGTQRSRYERLTLDVMFSSWRAGGPEQEPIARAAAYASLQTIENYVRKTDTRLGGAVEWCFLESHREEGTLDDELVSQGRLVNVFAQFRARARIRTT